MKYIISLLVTLCIATATFAQKGTVSGSVVDHTGEALPGATIVIMKLDSTQVTGQQR